MQQDPNGFKSFIHIPGSGGFQAPPLYPQPTPAPPAREPQPFYAVPPGPANNDPVLSVAYPNVLTLTRPLVAQLGLSKMGSARVNLVAPTQRGGQWYLDTNPKPGMGARFPARGSARFYIQHLSKRLFARPRPFFGPEAGAPFQGNVNVFVKLLHFRLGEQVEGYPGYYRLEPVTGPAHHSPRGQRWVPRARG